MYFRFALHKLIGIKSKKKEKNEDKCSIIYNEERRFCLIKMIINYEIVKHF